MIMKSTISVNFFLLLTLLSRLPSFQSLRSLKRNPNIIEDIMDMNVTGCNDEIIEIETGVRTHLLRFSAKGCPDCETTCPKLPMENDCRVTYRPRTDLIRKAYKFCASKSDLSCDVSIRLMKIGGEITLCIGPPKFCVPQSEDLQIVFDKNNLCAARAGHYFVDIDIQPVYPNTNELRYVSDNNRCPSTMPRIYPTRGTILSQYQPGGDMSETFCGAALFPKFTALFFRFCINFQTYDFVTGGAQLKIKFVPRIPTMIFNSSTPKPTGDICHSWPHVPPIRITLIPGEGPDSMTHSFLFHYRFETEVPLASDPGHGFDEPAEDEYEDDFDEPSNAHIYFILAFLIALTFVVFLYCIFKGTNNSSRAQRGSSTAIEIPEVPERRDEASPLTRQMEPTAPEHIEPPKYESPPAYDSLFPESRNVES